MKMNLEGLMKNISRKKKFVDNRWKIKSRHNLRILVKSLANKVEKKKPQVFTRK